MIPIVNFRVACLRPIPWSAPQVFMKERKGGGSRYKSAARNPEMEHWQAYVSLHAQEAMGGREPILTPVFASLTFYRMTEDPVLFDKVWFNGVAWNEKKQEYVKTGETVPDADNLAKSTLDAMQGIVFGNDVQVCVLSVARLWGSHDGARIVIQQLEPTDEI